MTVRGASAEARDVGDIFAEAMQIPARPLEPDSPPALDRQAPHGRDADGNPLAPYGFRADGITPKKSPAGRPPGGDRPRTVNPDDVPAEVKPGRPQAGKPQEAPKPSGRNYMSELSGFADMLWFGLSSASGIVPKIPIIGKLVPQEKLAAEACLLEEMKPRLVAAINLAAQHNVRAENFCKKLEGGDGLWALQCAFMVMPVASLAVTIWQGDEALEKGGHEVTLKEMASKNEEKMEAFLARIAAQMQSAAEQAMSVPGQVVEDA